MIIKCISALTSSSFFFIGKEDASYCTPLNPGISMRSELKVSLVSVRHSGLQVVARVQLRSVNP